MSEGQQNTQGLAFGRLRRPHRGDGPTSQFGSKTYSGWVNSPIILMVLNVKLPKRMDLATSSRRGDDAVPGRIVAGWRQA